jgi:hypothetical protein
MTSKKEDFWNSCYKNELETVYSKITTLKKGDIDWQNPNFQDTTPLYWAAQRGNTGLVEILLRNGANPNLGDKSGNTPLYLAATFNHIPTVKLLLEYGANTNSEKIMDNPQVKDKITNIENNIQIELLNNAGVSEDEIIDNLTNEITPKSLSRQVINYDNYYANTPKPTAPDYDNDNVITPRPSAPPYGGKKKSNKRKSKSNKRKSKSNKRRKTGKRCKSNKK